MLIFGRGLIMTYGTILAYYSDFLMPSVKLTVLGVIGSIPPALLLFGSLLLGRLVDAGYHRQLNVIGTICITAGLAGLARSAGAEGLMGSGKPWAISLCAVLIGFGQSCLFVNCAQTATTWYPKNKGLAIGFTSCGAAVGEENASFLARS